MSRPFLLVVAFASVLVGVGLQRTAPALAQAVEHRMLQGSGRNTVAQRADFGEAGALHEDVRRLSMGVDRAGRSSAPMQRLQPLDPMRVRMPKDLALFADELARFVDGPFADPTAQQELVRGKYLPRTHLGLDYFDASINRIAAWVIGTRNFLKALLIAMLEPIEKLRAAENSGDLTARLALQEEAKSMPFGAVWDAYCERQNVPVGEKWLAEVKAYEAKVNLNR